MTLVSSQASKSYHERGFGGTDRKKQKAKEKFRGRFGEEWSRKGGQKICL